MNVTACSFNYYCRIESLHRNGNACHGVGSEVRNPKEINKYLLSTYSGLGIETATEVVLVSSGSANRSTQNGVQEAVGSHSCNEYLLMLSFKQRPCPPGALSDSEKCNTRDGSLEHMNESF